MPQNLTATIVRGYSIGKVIKIGQWCNNWFTDEENNIYSPVQLQLSPETRAAVLAHNNNGIMLQLYDLHEDGTFTKKQRR